MSSAVAKVTRNARRHRVKQQLRKARPSPDAPATPPARLLDPSRTGVLRVKAAAAMRARYARLRSALYQRIVLEDALGLREDAPPWFTGNVFCPTGEGGGVDPTCSPSGANKRWPSASPKIAEELSTAASYFSEPALSDVERQKVYDWKTGNATLLKDPEFISAVEKGVVIKPITVYRAGRISTEKTLEFTTRSGWARDTAEASDRQLIAIHLEPGDKALFVPFFTDHHLVEVGVMIPPSTMSARPPVTIALNFDAGQPRDARGRWFTGNVFCPTGPGGGIDPTCSPGGSGRINSSAPKDVLEEVRRRGMATGMEHSVLTDRSGNRLAEQSGTEGSTDVPTHALSNKPGADLVVTHNHPDSGPPSPQDLKMFGTHVGVGELNAVGHDGTVYVVRPVGDRDALYRAVDAYVLEVSGKIADKVVRSKNLTDEGRDALKRERDALLGKVAEEMESRGLVEYAVHRPTTDNEGNPAQPRDARGRWAAVGGHVLSALSRAGAYAGHLEHSAKSYVEDRLSAGVSKLPPGLQRAVHATVHVGRAGTRVAFASWTAGQALAERVSRERGSTPEQARRLRAVVGALDLATFKPVSIALAATGVSAATLGVASFVPPASAAYLAYSTARDPLATWRAAKGLVREAAGRIGHRLGFTGNSAEDVLGEVAAYLTRNDGDWPFAVLLAAVEEAGDLRRGLEVAREAVRAEPTGNAEETGGGYGVTDNALWDVLPTADKLKSFGQWLKDTALDLWRGLAEDLRGIADLAFRRGAGRAFDEARAGRFIDPNYRAGGREQFIDSVFRDQGNRDRFDALKKRIDDEAANHRDSVVEKIERSINDSVLNDRTPTEAWKEITTVIDREQGSGVTTVTDEVVRDQAEGQIAGYDEAGVKQLFPLMEWTVHPEASKSGVCKRCMALKGTVWMITEARGKIPLHRNCKCSWTARPQEPPKPVVRSVPPIQRYAPGAGWKQGSGTENKFNPAEPRAADGKWTKGGAGGAGRVKAKAKESVKDTEPNAPHDVHAASLKMAKAKIVAAPVPLKKHVKQMRKALRLAARGLGRAGGDVRGNSTSRRLRRQQLFAEFGGHEHGYVACPWTGLKMHWAEPTDKANNPHGYPKFEQGKIFVACQGGKYTMPNLIPESFAANRSRNNKRLRKENSDGC